MRHHFLRAAIAVAGISVSSIAAYAADLPRYKAPAYTAPAEYSWTGFYIGGNVGYAFNQSNFNTIMDPGTHLGAVNSALVSAAGTGSASKGGFTGGLQLGYNWQISRFVLGIEADFNMLSGAVSQTGSGILTTADPFTVNNSLKPKWMATLRPRIGYAFDRFLVYGTGGVAFVHREYTQDYSDTLFNAVGGSSASDTKAGWVAGLGLEYGFMDHWSVKAEYLYAKFGAINTTGTVTSTTGGTNALSGSADLKTQSLRLGVNYRF